MSVGVGDRAGRQNRCRSWRLPGILSSVHREGSDQEGRKREVAQAPALLPPRSRGKGLGAKIYQKVQRAHADWPQSLCLAFRKLRDGTKPCDLK